MSQIIDVHHHFLPEEYVQAWKASGTIPPGLTPPQWSPDLDLSFMNSTSITTAILSLSAPGLSFIPPAECPSFARKINESSASIVASNPTRFGFFATLPISLPSIPIASTISELTHALGSLNADGVTLFTSYDGKYLGDGFFRPLWEELDRHGAVVFIHPASPPGPPGSGLGRAVPPPIIDFPHETTRTAVHLITSNTLRDFPNVKIILSHGGGTLPFVANRIANLTADAGLLGDKTADEFLNDARGFYFDLALTGFEGAMDLVLGFARPGHVLYGSDYPFCRERTVQVQIENVRGADGDGRIQGAAAARLFPRLAAASSTGE